MQTKIYIFSDGVSRKNGGSSSLLDLANNLIELKFEVTMITPFGLLDKFIYKPTNVSDQLNIRVLDNEIYRNLRDKTSNKKVFLNKILNIFKEKNIKNSIIIDGIGLPYRYINFLKSRKNKIVLNHAGSSNAYIKYFGMNGKIRNTLEESKNKYLEMIEQYDYILFQSQTQANNLKSMLNGKKCKILVLTPGVSENDIQKAMQKGNILNKNDFNITMVGSIQPRKGQHLVIDLAKKLKNKIKNIKFHIVGNILNQEYFMQIEKKIEYEGIKEYIEIHGFKSNYLEYMSSSDIILQLSEEEGVSRVLREAMALGKPIVSFALDGTNDLLENGKDSLLSPYGDLVSIQENILKLYEDKKLYEKLSKNIKQNFYKKYSKKQYQKKLQQIIKTIKE
jgi:glycosyltransferase involved in cell wall biosynthesis